LWANALAAGIAEDTYWNATPVEVLALMRAFSDRRREDHKAYAYNAAMIAAAVYNVHRPKGKPMFTAHDFFKEETRVVEPEDLAEVLKGWAANHNRRGGFVS
jgi:hypothetical protein